MEQPRFLIVPGLGLGAESWAPTIRELGRRGVEGSRVSVALLPGYGEPLAAGDPVDPRGVARRLLETSLRPGLPPGERPVLLGHSAGCQVAVHAAALAPERVRGLVLVAPSTDPRAATWPRLLGRLLATVVHEPPRQVPSLVRQYRRTGPLNMLRVMDSARRDDVARTLEDVDCPVRVLRGRHDRIAPEDWCRALGPSVTLPKGAHMVPLTHGDLTAREVARFGATVAGA